MPLQDDYLVSLDTFKGPLDLLLYLIRRSEVDIHDIPVAAITEQYLEFLRQIEHVDIELAGEFLVMAATLIELKSRTLMPPSPDSNGAQTETGDTPALAESDPRYELVQQLLAYQRYRIAAEELEEQRRAFAQRFTAMTAPPGPPTDEPGAAPVELELEDAHILDLFDAYERIVASIDFTRLGEHTVEMDDTPTQLHQEDLLDQLRRAEDRRIRLQDAFAGRTRLQAIGLFLALLELVRQRKIVVRQDRINDEIGVELNDDPENAVMETPEPAASSAVGDLPAQRAGGLPTLRASIRATGRC